MILKKLNLTFIVLILILFTSCDIINIRNEKLSRVKFYYDDNDRIVAITGPSRRKAKLDYDERGRIHKVKNSDGEVNYDYNSLNQLTQIEDNSGISNFEYDPNGRLAKMTYPQGDEIDYKYTESGDIASASWGVKHYLKYGRDLLGNIIFMETPSGTFQISYDHNNRTMHRIYPNGAFSHFEYGENGRPAHIQHVTPDNNLALEYRYKYDDSGLMKTAYEWSRNGEVEINYTYDAYGQLLQAQYSDGRVYTYEYDMFGNCVQWSDPTGVFEAAFNNLDQMTSLNGQPVTYDAAGNVILLDSEKYEFNNSDELINDSQNSYKYNALGLRVESQGLDETTEFLHMLDDLPYIFAETGNNTTQYFWADGQVLGQFSNNNSELFFFEDHLGSIRSAMDKSGNIIGNSEFSPFGIPNKRINGVKFGFTGEMQDETGKVYLRARYYEPKYRRFLSKDPVFSDLTGREKSNQYSYAANSPINYKDREGEEIEDTKPKWLRKLDNVPLLLDNTSDDFLKWIYKDVFKKKESDNSALDITNRNKSLEEWEKPNWQYKYYGERTLDIPLEEKKWNYILREYNINYEEYKHKLYPKLISDELSKKQRKEIQSLAAKKFFIEHSPILKKEFKIDNIEGIKVGTKFENVRNMTINTTKGPWSIDWTNTIASVKLQPTYSKIPTWVLGIVGKKKWFMERRTLPNRSSFDDKYPEEFRNSIKFLDPILNGDMHPAELFQEDNVIQLQIEIENKSRKLTDLIIGQIQSIKQIQSIYDVSSGPGQVAGPGGYASSEAYAALNAFRNNQSGGTPNVGGVYLDKAAEIIGELGSIDGIVFDPVSNRIILIGKGVEGTSLPALNLEDLATAYRTVFGNYTTEPGVTIDPDSQNPYADSMNIVFFGGTENTHFGHILLEADRQMKGLSLGEDNVTHQKMEVDVNGYYNLLDLGFSNLGGSYNKGLWSRFWLVPDRVIVKVYDDKKSISFPDTRIRIKTETMRWQNGKLVSANGQVDEKAEYFAAHFTKYYDEYAKEYPVYKELKDLANLVGFLKWLKESGNPVDLGWLQKYEKPYNTPDKTPSLKVSDSRQTRRGGTQTISIFGGTELTIKNNYIEDEGITKEYEEKAIIAVTENSGVVLGEFSANDGTMKKVLALPTSQTRSPGAKMINGNELKLITRLYCSFHNSQGPFGYSWEIDLPKLYISRPSRGEISYKIVGDQKVEIMNFHLTRPFGLQDVLFKKEAIDQQTGRFVFLPENQGDIKRLYPENGQYQVEYFNGKIEKYDNNGILSYIELTPDMYVKYSYNSLGKLESVILTENNKSVSTVKLFYDSDNRVAKAEVDGEEIRYNYDASGNLVRILQGDETIDYFYNELHLITEIHNNEEVSESMEYDGFGRLQKYKTSNSESLPVGIQLVENETVITKSNGNEKTISKYDAGGRLLEVDYGNGSLIKNKFHPNGSLAASEYTNHFGDKVTIEYSPDGRYIKHTDSEGHLRALLYNELGQLLQVQNETNALLTKDYQLTTTGWMESTEDSEKKVQVFQDKSSKSVKQVITAKNPYGGQLITEIEYTNANVIQQITSGLINDTRIFDKGKLVEQNFGKQKTSYSYDNNERLNMVSTSAGKIEVTYDPTGLIFQTDLLQGNFRETNSFQDGQLINRTSSLGLDDIFQYNKDGMLESLDRIDGEFWFIERKDNKTRILRNNKLQREFIWDKKGRLAEKWY